MRHHYKGMGEITEGRDRRTEKTAFPPTTPKKMVCLGEEEDTQHNHQQTVGTGGVKALVPQSPCPRGPTQEEPQSLPTYLEPRSTKEQLQGLPSGTGLCWFCPGSQRNLIRGLGLVAKHTSFHQGEAETPAWRKHTR